MKNNKLRINKETISKLENSHKILGGYNQANAPVAACTDGCSDGCSVLHSRWNCTDANCTADCQQITCRC
jgi:hypothetical protein